MFNFFKNISIENCLSADSNSNKNSLPVKFYSVTSDKHLTFTDQKFHFYNPLKSTDISSLLINKEEILMIFISEIEKACCPEDRCLRSNLYTIYKNMYCCRPSYLRVFTFMGWLKHQSENSTDEQLVGDISKILDYSLTTYKCGYVFGIMFTGRVTALPVVDWKSCWHSSVQRSCWCKYKEKTIDKYGLINYFVRVNLPSEPLIHGLPIMNITPVDTTKTYATLHEISLSCCQEIKCTFIAATSIYSTTIGIVGLNSIQNAITGIIKWIPFVNRRMETKLAKDVLKRVVTFFDKDVSHYVNNDNTTIVLIDLERHRLNICYDRSRISVYNNN